MDIRLVVLTLLFVAVSGYPHGRHCPVSRYITVSPNDINLLKQLQSESEKNITSNAMRCYRRMLKHKPSVCDLTPSDRLILTLERVSLTVDVLEDMSTSALPDPVSQSLMVFLKLRDDLMICKETPEYSDPASQQLKPWLHHLQHFKEVASPECVQDAVLLSLVSLRVEDVSCWALRNPSVET
ncbi:interferon lambda-2-like [Mixophyes fleayi]|uniref:interferon lambda-2-like n=1 Tax=Mixophyes fleayi TaxID=3061075 RepID=UPI003F4DC3AB